MTDIDLGLMGEDFFKKTPKIILSIDSKDLIGLLAQPKTNIIFE